MAFTDNTTPQKPHTTQSSLHSPLSNQDSIHTMGPWPNYSYPSKWELSDDFMCVHFIPKTADKTTWSSQCSFWNEAISLYTEQLLYQCPFKYNRLTFTPSDIKRVHQRKNQMIPMCIIDIIKWMKYKQNHVILLSFLEQNYNKIVSNHETNTNNSFLSISTVSSIMSSMIGYLIQNDETDDEDNEFDQDNDIIKEKTKIIYVPVLDKLCDALSHLNFYNKISGSNGTGELSQLMDIGIISIENTLNKEWDEFIINGLVFYRFCIEILRLTPSDVMILKKYLYFKQNINIFYLNDDIQQKIQFSDEILDENLKNEMICFNINNADMLNDKETLSKMQLLSINLTMKHLKLQKTENEQYLNDLNKEILSKLARVSSRERKAFMQKNLVLLKRKKALKNRISTLDGSIYNLESTLHSMEDIKINKMVFNEMKNADNMLKYIIGNGPSIEEIHEMKHDLNESIQINQEIGDVLSKTMDTDYDDIDIDDDELFKEYQELELMQNVDLPDAPNHDIVIKDIVVNDVESNNDKEMLMN